MRWLFCVLLFQMTTPAWALRELSAGEQSEMIRAIGWIQQTWSEAATSNDLRTFLVQGRIFAEDDWPPNERGRTTFPILGPQVIVIHAQTIPRLTDRKYSLSYGENELFEDRAQLAGVLVHEWFHTTQSWAQIKLTPWTVEKPAWQKQREFLESLLKKYADHRYYCDRLEFLIDKVTSEINGE